MDITVLVYLTWIMGLTNNILRDVIGTVFKHIPPGMWREEYRIQYK